VLPSIAVIILASQLALDAVAGTSRQGTMHLFGECSRAARGTEGAREAAEVREAMRHVLFYESGDLSLAAEHFPAHKARYTEFMDRGVLLALGPFADGAGSIAVFTTHEAAMDFASGDPFVEHGVVSAWQVRDWRVVAPD
jgi:hypothetical protein